MTDITHDLSELVIFRGRLVTGGGMQGFWQTMNKGPVYTAVDDEWLPGIRGMLTHENLPPSFSLLRLDQYLSSTLEPLK